MSNNVDARFNCAWEYIKQNEGGYVNDKYDRGGATKYGISLRFLQGTEEGDLNNDGVIDEDDIVLLSEKKAKDLYKTYFWIPSKANKIKSKRVAIKIFDMSVNFGVRQTHDILAKILSNIYVNYKDDQSSDSTVEMINSTNVNVMLSRLVKESLLRYKTIVRNNPSQARFLNGWTVRAKRLP